MNPGEGYEGTPVGGLEGRTIVNKIKGELIYDVLLHSPSASIPQMSNLKVQIKSILLFKNNVSPAFKKIKGDWNTSIALDEQFVKNNLIAYTPQNSSKDVNVISSEMLPTGFVVKFIVNTPVDESIVTKAHLVDSNGNSYNSSGSASMERTADNKDLVSMTFEVSSFDQIDSFKFLVKDINGESSEVTLVKSKK